MSALFDSSSVIAAGPKSAVTAATVSGGVAYVAFDDGTLRCYNSVPDSGDASAFDARAVYPKFWKDLKKLCRSLLVVQEWNLLFSMTEDGVTAYSLDRLSKPGTPFMLLPHCIHLSVKYDEQIDGSAEPIALAAASKSKVLAWEWTGARAGQPGTESVKTGLLDLSSLFNVSAPLVERTLAGHDLELSTANSNRSRGLSFLFSSNANNSKGEQEADLSSIPCVTRLDWAGDLLSVSVVHRIDVPVLDDEDGSAGEENAAQLQVIDATNADLEASIGGSVGDTGFVLTYLILSPWTESIVRLVRAGPSPPLSTNGLLQLPVAHGADGALGASAGHSLVSALGGTVPSPPGPNKPAPTVLLAWGAATLWRAKPKHNEELHSDSSHSLAAASRLKLPVRPAAGLDSAVLRLNAASSELEQTSRMLDPGMHEYLAVEGEANNDSQLVLALTIPTEEGPKLGSAILSLQGVPVQDPCCFSSGGGMGSRDDLALGPVLAYYACKSLPYIITCHTQGVTVVDVRTGQVAQSMRLQAVLGIAHSYGRHSDGRDKAIGSTSSGTGRSGAAEAAPSSRRAPSQQLGSPTSQMNQVPASSKDTDEGLDGEDGHMDEHGDGADSGDVGNDQANVDSTPAHAEERVFVFTRSGVICLTPVPLPDQLELLLSQDPPMLETAVQLCEGAALQAENNTTTSGVPMDVDLVAGRESDVRAQQGYVQFAEGRYAAGIAQLYRAGVPWTSVLALYPSACGNLAGHSVAADWRIPGAADLPPFASPVQGRLQLATALPSLLWYLHAQCVRLREEARKDATGLTDKAGSSGYSGSDGLSPLTIVEEILVGCLLLDAQLARQDARHLQQSAAKGDDEDDYVSGRVQALHARAQLRQCQCISLLSYPNSVRAVAVTALLKHYESTSILGEPETLAVYHGKGDVEQVVKVLRSAAESAVLAGTSVGLSVSTGGWTSMEELAEAQPIVDHVRALAVYVRTLGNAHASLVLDVVQRMLQGRMGRIGVPLAFWVLCPPISWIRAASTAGKVGTGAYEPLDAAAVMTLLQSVDAGQSGAAADHAQWWSLRGYCLPHLPESAGQVSLQDLLACVYASDGRQGEKAPSPGVYPALATVPAGNKGSASAREAEADTEESSHADRVNEDLRVMPPPSFGWSPSYTAAYLEYCLAVAHALGMAAPDAARILPKDGIQTLLQSYIALLSDACSSLDLVPPGDLHDDKGIIRELRGKLQGLLAYVHGHPAIATAVDAEDALELFDRAFPAHKPCGGLLFERALLLRQAGKHEEALKLLLWELQDLHAAEQYCQSLTTNNVAVVQRSPSASIPASAGVSSPGIEHAYNALLTTYLARRPTSITHTASAKSDSVADSSPTHGMLKPNKASGYARAAGRVADISDVEHAADGSDLALQHAAAGHFSVSQMLLNRRMVTPTTSIPAAHSDPDAPATPVTAVLNVLCMHPECLQASEALASLPDTLPVAQVLPLLESTARYSKDHMRSLVVAKSFAAVSFTRAHAKLVGLQSKKASVEKISICGVCKRRVAAGGRSGPFVLHPDGMVTHVSCMSARTGAGGTGTSAGLGSSAAGEEQEGDRAGDGKERIGTAARRGSRSGVSGLDSSPGSKAQAGVASQGIMSRAGAPAPAKALNSGGVVW